MLGLKLKTDPRWATLVETDVSELLTDHAWCEQKAATNAMFIIINNSEHQELVTDMLAIAKEELDHFEQVHEIIKAKGFTLGRERKDSYVNELVKFMKKGGSRIESLIDRLLFSAMIEARSCERFKVLANNIEDKELAQFYNDLMISEAGHYTIFINHARKLMDKMKVDERWKEWLEYEEKVIKSYGTENAIHG
jgi:tRNA-(ms[2]io[6]A)-hydroxylase